MCYFSQLSRLSAFKIMLSLKPYKVSPKAFGNPSWYYYFPAQPKILIVSQAVVVIAKDGLSAHYSIEVIIDRQEHCILVVYEVIKARHRGCIHCENDLKCFLHMIVVSSND